MGTDEFPIQKWPFFRRARPHKGLRRGVLNVRRSRKAAENAARRKKGHLWMETRTYLKNKVRVQGKAWNGEKAEHTRSM